jgi:hypothetical protein
MSGHTPGPWATEYMKSSRGGYAQQIFDANGVLVATAAWYPVRVSESTTATNREANARLIAAAPDLLEALEAMYEMFNGNGITPDDDAAIIAARSAIAKATGAHP